MIKNFLIKRKLISARSKRAKSTDYASVHSIGLLFNEHQETDSLRFLQEQFAADGKHISTMMRVAKHDKQKSYDHPFFFHKDVGINGSIHSDLLDEFVRQPMDILVVLDNTPDLLTSYVASKCNGLKVGFYPDTAPIQLLDLLLKPKNEPAKYNDLLTYIRKVT